MHWDRKRNKWTSQTQQRRDERRDAKMSLFRKKKDESQVSAFDQIPAEIQGKLIEDVLTIVRTVKAWPSMIPENLHKPIGEEISTLLRKTGLKLAAAFMGGDMGSEDFAAAFKGISMPNLISQTWIAIKLGLEADHRQSLVPGERLAKDETETPPAVCAGGWPMKYGQHHPSCDVCTPEGPNGKAA